MLGFGWLAVLYICTVCSTDGASEVGFLAYVVHVMVDRTRWAYQ